jgi:hypothetical protein
MTSQRRWHVGEMPQLRPGSSRFGHVPGAKAALSGSRSIAMRHHTLIFRLSAATAIAGLVLAQAIPQPALAQPGPPGTAPAAPGQQAGDPPERAGWLSQIGGTVSFHTQDQDQWTPAAMNYPVASGDAFWTEPNASARITISSSRVALAGGTELDVGTLDANGLQATMPQGEIYLQLRSLAQNETWSVQTPRGLVTFAGDGRYGVAAGDTQNPTTVTVLEGSAQVTGAGLSLQVAQGQAATINGTDTFQGTVGAVQMDTFLTAMQQPEQSAPAPVLAPAAAPPAVVAQIPGGGDLSAYGSWSQTTDNGQVWYPQVAAGWAPYRDGHWAFIPPWGWTWVDAAPWGFAPFHYGRWFQDGGRWGWTPGVVAYDGPPVYAPALVAFIGLGVGIGIGAALASGSIGWVPLGPREAYHPWYHSSDGYLRSVNRREVTNITAINNRNVTVNNFVNRGAATVVPARAMAESRPVSQVAEHVDPRTLATARPIAGTALIRPTAATAGITPGLARQMRLAPAPAGTAAVARVAPGPAIHAGPTPLGVAPRPALRSPAERAGVVATPGGAPAAGTPERTETGARPGVVAAPGATPALRTPAERAGGPPGIAATPGGERPPGGPEHVEPGARPGVVAAPGATPALRTPGEREAGPPPIEHGAPGGVGERTGTTPTGIAPSIARPGVPVGGPERPALASPTEPARPPAESHGAPALETHAPAAVLPGTAHPEVHAPQPQVHALVPQVHAPTPQVHARAPQVHVAPRSVVHSPAPQMHAVSHPAPAPHPAAAPHPAPAPHPQEKKK